MQKRIVFLVVSVLLSALLAEPAEAGTSISQAKSLIRNLYYGHQQASQRSLDAENAYILAHNYPGMYSSARQCLLDSTSDGTRYGPATPNLSTIDFDKSWRVPTGLPKYRLIGKKPKGETFVVDVNWTIGGLSTNHVTILKGKAYYFLWICGS